MSTPTSSRRRTSTARPHTAPTTSTGAGRRRRSDPAWREYAKALGPGIVTGASDDDPSGVATYSQTGAQFGLTFLWVALATLPLTIAIQVICDRAAIVTGRGLGELARTKYGRVGVGVVSVLLVALLVANTLNIAADLVAIGSGMTLLHAGPTWLWALIAGLAIALLLVAGTAERISVVFKLLSAALLTYLVVAVMVTHAWGPVLEHAVVPDLRMNDANLSLLVAILGTTISPYLFFWQSAHRLEELREAPEGGDRIVPLRQRRNARRAWNSSRLDVVSGMTFSNIVMFAIIVATSETLHAHGKTNITSAAQAAQALHPLAGSDASWLFALGFIGSGLLAVPVLAGSGSVAISGLFGQRWGFSRSVRKAPVFYALVMVGTLGGMALSLVHVNPIKMLVAVAAINGVIAGPCLVLVMLITRDRSIMGAKYVNGRITTVLGWLSAALMVVAAGALFATGGISF